jgi:8-hydroxy-5-deazaflavin:NADPH oxidoreductase
MEIAIIGSGNVGSALAQSTTRAGHSVRISSADRDQAEEVARATGGRVAASNREAAEGADAVILAVPATTILDVAGEIADAVAGRPLVDVSNRPTPDTSRPGCRSIAEEIQERVPEARVVKAFNTVFAARQQDPVVVDTSADGFVAGDDANAKGRVLELVGSIGMRPIDCGGLVFARTLEGMGWLHITLVMQGSSTWQSAWKLVGPAAD